MDRSALDAAYAAAVRYLQGLPERPVGASADAAAMRAALAVPLTEQGEPAARVVEALARNADPGIVASGGPRLFGFVLGGRGAAAPGARLVAGARGPEPRPLRPVPAAGGRRGGGGWVG